VQAAIISEFNFAWPAIAAIFSAEVLEQMLNVDLWFWVFILDFYSRLCNFG
jgi:hypothetical protein